MKEMCRAFLKQESPALGRAFKAAQEGRTLEARAAG
jgi:hypothetical protein